LLGLGNELLADDAFGILVAREAQARFGDRVEVVTSSAAGFHLLDHLLGTPRLLVVDTVLSGKAEPGTIRLLAGKDLRPVPVVSPHFLGLFDVLAVARKLGMAAPSEVAIIAVEAADCATVGGAMHPAVEAAIPEAVRLVGEFLNQRTNTEGPSICMIQGHSG
jgi:hydrogenase maturation protease